MNDNSNNTNNSTASGRAKQSYGQQLPNSGSSTTPPPQGGPGDLSWLRFQSQFVMQQQQNAAMAGNILSNGGQLPIFLSAPPGTDTALYNRLATQQQQQQQLQSQAQTQQQPQSQPQSQSQTHQQSHQHQQAQQAQQQQTSQQHQPHQHQQTHQQHQQSQAQHQQQGGHAHVQAQAQSHVSTQGQPFQPYTGQQPPSFQQHDQLQQQQQQQSQSQRQPGQNQNAASANQPGVIQQQQHQQQQSHSLKHEQDDLLTREQQRLLCERQLQLYGGGLSGLGNLVLTPEQRSMIFSGQDQLKNLYRQKWPAGAADPAQLAQTQQQQFLLQQQQMWAAQQSLGGAATPWSSLASQTQALGKDLSQRMASSKDFVDDNDRKRTSQAAGRGTKRTSSDASKHSGELYADMPRIKRPPMRSRQQNIGSKFRGVSWHKRDRRWLARLWVNYKIKYLGSFLSEERAALAVDDEAIASIGPDAHRLNFSSEEEREALREKFRKEDEAQKLAAGGVNRPKLASESAAKRSDSAVKDDTDALKSTTSGGAEKSDQEGTSQKAFDEQQSAESHSTTPAEPTSDTNESKQVADVDLSPTS